MFAIGAWIAANASALAATSSDPSSPTSGDEHPPGDNEEAHSTLHVHGISPPDESPATGSLAGHRKDRALGRAPMPQELGIAPTPIAEPYTFGEMLRDRYRRCQGIPCTRPGLARLMLGALGAATLTGGTAMIMLIPRWSEPGGWLAGSGAVALGGVFLGSIVGVVSRENQSVDDHVAPVSFGIGYDFGAAPHLDEQNPGRIRLDAAPVLRIQSNASVLRIFARTSIPTGDVVHVDPRPQNDFGTALRTRSYAYMAAVEFASWMPYPRERSRRRIMLGPVELALRMQLEGRRDYRKDHAGEGTLVERHMFLPLILGMQWHLSTRQRFTARVGPRLDFVAFRASDHSELQYGSAQWGRVYGEAWYDLHFPLTPHREPTSGRRRRWNASGQLRLGYRHAMFDGLALNAGAVVGFTGPMYAGWAMRWRVPGSSWGFQAGTGIWIADQWSAHLDFGIVAPDIRPSRYRALARQQARHSRKRKR